MDLPKKKVQTLTKERIVISHGSCDDGMGAAWAAWKKFGDTADYWFAAYNSQPPDVANKEVYVLDFSYERNTLERMHSEAKSLVVIDHHASAERRLKGLPYCHFNEEKSGAMLAWEYFHPNLPSGVLLYHVQDYDLWKFECERTIYFSKALTSYPQNIQTWDTLNNGFEDHVNGKQFYDLFIADGKAIDRYYQAQIKSLLKSATFPVTIEGVSGLGSNVTGIFASELGNEMAKISGTFGFTYFLHSDGFVKCSLRSTSGQICDVSQIAEKFGGGGHASASGFTITRKQLEEILDGAN